MLLHWFELGGLPWLAAAFCLTLAALVALAVDRWLGEPPARWHPVVWMGKALGVLGERVAPVHPTGPDFKAFCWGALAWCAIASAVVTASAALQFAVLRLLQPGATSESIVPLAQALRVVGVGLALGFLLKPLLALAMLQSEARAVEDALAQSLSAGRARLAWLVSRDVSALSADEVRQSAMESLAENLNDSVVAPLFWFAVAGLPGAALYRFANTADAMWGYPGMRSGHYWQWAGKWAARADDGLSWLPARITALLISLVAGGLPLHALGREARKTPSPNSGWPMAAMALALRVCLSKPGHYRLNSSARAPTEGDAEHAQNLVSKVALALILIALSALLLIVAVVVTEVSW